MRCRALYIMYIYIFADRGASCACSRSDRNIGRRLLICPSLVVLLLFFFFFFPSGGASCVVRGRRYERLHLRVRADRLGQDAHHDRRREGRRDGGCQLSHHEQAVPSARAPKAAAGAMGRKEKNTRYLYSSTLLIVL